MITKFKGVFLGASLVAAFSAVSGKVVAEQPAETRLNWLDRVKMPIVDVHMHTGIFETMGPLGQKFLMSNLPAWIPDEFKRWSLSQVAKIVMVPYNPIMGIKAQCERARSTKVGLMAVYAHETWGVTTNEQIIQYLDDPRNQNAAGDPYFFGYASLSLENWPEKRDESIANLRSALHHPMMKAIKLAFIHTGKRLDDPSYDAIYDVAEEFGVPVYHHVGSSPLQKLNDLATQEQRDNYLASYNPRLLERAIRKYPSVKFVLGHVGYDFNHEGHDYVPEVFRLAETFDNVLLEISAFGHPIHDHDGKEMDRVLREVKQRNLVSKVIYGSDGPVVPGYASKYLEVTLQGFQRAGFSQEEQAAILAGNANRFYKL
jgi:predicted TIM-barrel fold metal-dependent hydrolase